MPEVGVVWQAGARHLEVGCGIGNSLLGTVTTYPRVTAVGIEINALTAAEADWRARALEVHDRVEVRRMDACDLKDESTFDTIQWSQFFFPAATRPVVLQAMQKLGRKGFPLTRVYRNLYDEELFLGAYNKLYRNAGSMTPGTTAETVDGMSSKKISQIIESLRQERYYFKPARRDFAQFLCFGLILGEFLC
jgi:SAM-dependent methyltransferase